MTSVLLSCGVTSLNYPMACRGKLGEYGVASSGLRHPLQHPNVRGTAQSEFMKVAVAISRFSPRIRASGDTLSRGIAPFAWRVSHRGIQAATDEHLSGDLICRRDSCVIRC